MKLPSLRTLLSTAAMVCVLTAAAHAADPTGTWKWTTPGRDGTPRPAGGTFALKDGVLTGSITGRGGEIQISDASFKDDMIAFSVTQTFGDNSITTKYSGKLDGDTITGTIARPAMGERPASNTDWKATRGDAAPAAPAN